MRIQIALALLPILSQFSADELLLLAAGVSASPVVAPFDKFADRIEETKAICGFLPRVAAITLPPIS